MLKLGVIGSLRSVESVRPNGNWKPMKVNLITKELWKVLVVGFKKWKVLGN